MNNTKNEQHTIVQNKKITFSYRIGLAFIIVLFALVTAGYIGEYGFKNWGLTLKIRYGLQAIIMSAIVIAGVWLLRKKIDKGSPFSIGLTKLKESILKFFFGFGLFVGPLLVTLCCIILFGWGSVHINVNNGMLESFIIGLSTVFFFEALPEELIFRGYIYSNLNVKYKRWVSALLTVALFLLLPVTAFPIQKLLGMDIVIGSSNKIEVSYIINMLLFGLFQIYLRILTNSIWACVGFHVIFVYINHNLIGTEPSNFIQISGITSEGPLQAVLISCLFVVFLSLILYPIFAKRKIGWRDRCF